MAKILLLNPTYRGRSEQRSMPHGLMAVAAALEPEGHDIRLIDFHLENHTPVSAIDRISSYQFDIVGISGISTAYYFWKEFVALFRSRFGTKIPIMAGGSVASTLPETFLKHIPVDAICTGDAEPIINPLVDRLLKGASLQGLDGIGYRESAKVIIRPGARVVNMDTEVPLPSYSLVDPDRYRWKNWDVDKEVLEFVLFSSRGCPHRCFFCSRNFGRRFMQHSTDIFIAHIQYVVSKFSPDRLCFSDELFTLKKEWVLDFLSKYEESGIKIPFRVNSRVNTVDREMLLALKAAGCCDIGFGIESGSPAILRQMNKQVTVEQNLEALLTAKDVGLNATLTIVLGMPLESLQTIAETKQLLIQADTKSFGCFFATAYPESDLFEYAISNGYIKDVDAYMQKVDNADRLVINYSTLDNRTLASERDKLIRDVSYAWHRKRGFFSMARFIFRPLFTAYRVLKSQGLQVLIEETKRLFYKEKRRHG